jgi:hypothetical protein
VEGSPGISTGVWIDESLDALVLFARPGGESRGKLPAAFILEAVRFRFGMISRSNDLIMVCQYRYNTRAHRREDESLRNTVATLWMEKYEVR